MKRTVLLFSIAIFGVLGQLQATSVQRLSFEELVAKSQAIVQGSVVSTKTYRSSDGKLILTSYTIQVSESLKGSPGKTVTLTTVGGRIGNTVLQVSGMPVFQPGENAVLFLEQAGPYTTVVGLNQGKFTVANGKISNSVAGLSFPDGGYGSPVRMPLDEFKRQVKLRLNR
jgi:microcompartment protein CcmK/EutM